MCSLARWHGSLWLLNGKEPPLMSLVIPVLFLLRQKSSQKIKCLCLSSWHQLNYNLMCKLVNPVLKYIYVCYIFFKWCGDSVCFCSGLTLSFLSCYASDFQHLSIQQCTALLPWSARGLWHLQIEMTVYAPLLTLLKSNDGSPWLPKCTCCKSNGITAGVDCIIVEK